MPPVYRILEIACYSLLNFFPFLYLVMFPFEKSLRFSKKVTGILVFILSVLQVIFGILVALLGKNSAILSIISTGTYLLFYLAAVKVRLGKKVFMLLMISNLANFIVVASKFLESRIFPELALQSYRYSYSICMIFVELVTCIPLYFYLKKYCVSAMNYKVTKGLWGYLWIVPLTFYIIWYYHLYSRQMTSLMVAVQIEHFIWLTAINIGALLVYTMIFQLINEIAKNQKLSEENQSLEMQKLQYSILEKKMKESRHARHDLRHQMHLLYAYLKDGKLDELKEFLEQYQNVLKDDTPIFYCDHYAVNMLLVYYSQYAKEHKISFDVSIQIPKALEISDNALTVLMGNLLENACDACMEGQREDAFVRVRGKVDGDCLFFMIENSNSHQLKGKKDGYYLSTKHSGTGIGLASAQDIVKQYNGKMEIQAEEVFRVSVILPIVQI